MANLEGGPNSNVEKEKKIREAEQELDSIDLNPDKLRPLSPDEIHSLHSNLADLLYSAETTRTLADLPDSPEIRGISGEEQTRIAIQKLHERGQELLKKTIDDERLRADLTEKIREYHRSNWREAFANEITQGRTPFGDASNSIIEFYRTKGINIENPTEEDIDKYFERKEYDAAAFGLEFKRRRRKQFADMDNQKFSDFQSLFWRMFRVPDGHGWFTTLMNGKAFVQKLDEINEALKHKTP